MNTSDHETSSTSTGASRYSSGKNALVDDRRSFERTARPLELQLIGCGCGDVAHCNVRNISEGGVFVVIPPGQEVTVGQRYDLRLIGRGTLAAMDDTDWSATVIRTERIAQASPGAIGAAMRFDQPIYL
ncbi:MAG: PilZ domain-containing protein [Phycisphaerae bacterium]|nr:PilZ domain-containing protein [Phycisphaerae bacterium]